MKRNLSRLFAAVIAVSLAACVTSCASPPTIEAVPLKTGFTGFATLTSVGTFEWTAAPTWTRLAQLRHNAARALGKKEISVDAAKHIQKRADTVRSLLDDATAAAKRGDAAKAADLLSWAIAGLEDAEITLKGTP